MLSLLNRVNDVEIYSLNSDEFKTYGRILSGYDFGELISYMEEHTGIPEQGNVYEPSVCDMEKSGVKSILQQSFYGSMPIQIGYCNGKNSTYNGFEYHKGSEINIAVTDFMLVLGHVWQIKNNTFKIGDEKVFFVERGTAIEMYQTTLHLSPCRTDDEGFKAVVVLPRGTNSPLEEKAETDDPENRLLLQKNKWVIAHPEREALISQGAFPGLLGENKELKYKD